MRERSRLFGRQFAIPLVGALIAAALLLNPAKSQNSFNRRTLRTAQLPATGAGQSPFAEAPLPPGSRPPLPAARSPDQDDSDSGTSISAGAAEALQESNAQPEQTVDGSDPLPNAADTGELLPPEAYTVPLRGGGNDLVLESEDGLISLVARNAPLQDILTALAETQGLNLVIQDSVSAQVNTTLHRLPFEDVLDVILSTTGATWVRNRNVIQVTSIADAQNLAPETQGRQVEVFQLDYVSADDVSTVVQTMLSPAGSVNVIASSQDDNRRTQEIIVVQDLPSYVENIRHYILRHDIPPRQVLIEAYILKVELASDANHGVNFNHLFNMEGNGLTLESRGFANSAATQGFMVSLNGGNLTGVIEMLENTTDAKTLASPKIRVLNGQTARIQVGEQLGFRVTTTTETSTTESVEFLDVGVVLEVTPRIGSDGTVILNVRPEVSSGQVNPNTGLPEEETTELETDVMFHDNQAYVIGGLIQDTDTDVRRKLPWLGDLKHVGHLFQRAEVVKRRSEVIIALLPRVMPHDALTHHHQLMQTERATTPLLYGPLLEQPRPWEPQLPHVVKNPHMLRLPPTVTAGISKGFRAVDPFGVIPKASTVGEEDGLAPSPAVAPSPESEVPPPVYTTGQINAVRSSRTSRMSRLPATTATRVTTWPTSIR